MRNYKIEKDKPHTNQFSVLNPSVELNRVNCLQSKREIHLDN